MTSTVLMNLISFFILTIIFFNNTKDKTAILSRILGITIVTILLNFQMISFFWLQSTENSFDQIHIARAKENFSESFIGKNQSYLLVYSIDQNKIVTENGALQSIDLHTKRQLIHNAHNYFKFSQLPRHNFKSILTTALDKTESGFAVYKSWIKQAVSQNKINNSQELISFLDEHKNRIRYLKSKLRAIPDQKWSGQKRYFYPKN